MKNRTENHVIQNRIDEIDHARQYMERLATGLEIALRQGATMEQVEIFINGLKNTLDSIKREGI